MVPSALDTIDQPANALAEDVVDYQRHVSIGSDGVANRRAGVKWVWVVVRRHFCHLKKVVDGNRT